MHAKSEIVFGSKKAHLHLSLSANYTLLIVVG